MGNFAKAGGSHASGTKSAGAQGSGLASYVSSLIDRSLTWDDIRWLKKTTTMKVVIKGVLSGEDAIKGLEAGADAIWVSNHGARQLDTTPATIESLKEVVDAVAGRCEVYLDGGITRGTDALKALAIGARAVFVGRPVLWGLAHSGEQGVIDVMTLLNEELKLALALAGQTEVQNLKPSLVRHAAYFQQAKL
jgi:(S)-2-hydroxy-acid oxidase